MSKSQTLPFRPRKSELWSHEAESKLIKFMKCQPCTWDPSDVDYPHTEFKMLLYQKLASALGSEFTGDMVRDRWTNMRTTFAANYKRMKVKQEPGSPTWIHYDQLTFLQPIVESRKSIANRLNTSSTNPPRQKDDKTHEIVKPIAVSMEYDRPFQIYFDAKTSKISRSPESGGSSLYIYKANLEEDIPLMDASQDNQEGEECMQRESISTTSLSFQATEQECGNVIQANLEEDIPLMDASQDNQEGEECMQRESVPVTSSSFQATEQECSNVIQATINDEDEWDDFGRMVAKILRRMPERDAREIQVEFFKILFAKSTGKT